MLETVVEFRDPVDGRLKELVFDESQPYVQRQIDSLVESGVSEVVLVANPNNFALNNVTHTNE